MVQTGITGYSAFLPWQSMSRQAMVDAIGWTKPALKGFSKGARRFAAWDEDAITMSVAAARPLCKNRKNLPNKVCFASTTAPFLDRQNAGVIAAALDLPRETHCYETSGSQRAAVSALINIANSDSDDTLLVASDKRNTQTGSVLGMLSGDGGAALTIGKKNVLAEIVGTNSVYADFVDHYRTAQSGTDYVLEDRWYRDEGLLKIVPLVVNPLLENAGISAKDIDHFVFPVPNSGMSKSVAKALGVAAENTADGLYEKCGYTGAAHPLMMLVNVLENAKPGQTILLCAFGQGCDAVLLKTTAKISQSTAAMSLKEQLDSGHIEQNYTRFLAASGKLDIDWGMRAERDNRTAQSVAYNKSRDIYGFVGGKCGTCETPQFPKSRRCVNPQCGALDTQTNYRFADRNAKIKSFTEDWLAFTRAPPLMYGNVSFAGGGNAFLEMIGFEPGQVEIGTAVKPVFRIKDIDTQRGFHRYFWKVVPVEGTKNV